MGGFEFLISFIFFGEIIQTFVYAEILTGTSFVVQQSQTKHDSNTKAIVTSYSNVKSKGLVSPSRHRPFVHASKLRY